MKKLLEYLNSLSKDDRASFVVACGTSEGYLRKAASVGQKLGAELCILIERESGSAVTCEELRPDVDWAFIRASGHRTPRDGQRRTEERRAGDRRADGEQSQE